MIPCTRRRTPSSAPPGGVPRAHSISRIPGSIRFVPAGLPTIVRAARPPKKLGGRAALTIVGKPAGTNLMLPGILEIECALGTPPGGAEEGVRLLVQGIIHFNKSVHESGENVFVKL